MRDPVWHGEGVPDGRRLPVMLVPGFLAGDPSLSLLKRWLRARNYWTCTSQIRVNVDCTRTAVERLERRLVEFTDRMGRPAAIVGQSRGGIFAKLVAMRRPDRVCGIVTLGSAGVPGMFRDDCLDGECAEKVAEWLAQPFPAHVPYVSVYSRSDWVVDWRACVDPDADNVEIDSSHAGMSVHPRVYELLGERLGALAERAPSELGATG